MTDRGGDAPTVDRFHLNGLSRRYDPRTTPARRDLVDIRLAGSIFAPHYARALTWSVKSDTGLWATSDLDGEPLSRLLAGEPFDVLEVAAGRAWGCAADGSVGYVDVLELIDALPSADPLAPLPGSIADRAKALVGTPYLAGGRSSTGVDLAGFLFLALGGAAGIPRFLPMQRASGSPVDVDDVAPGDLLFVDEDAAVLIDRARVATVDAEIGVTAKSLNDWLAGRDGLSARRIQA